MFQSHHARFEKELEEQIKCWGTELVICFRCENGTRDIATTIATTKSIEHYWRRWCHRTTHTGPELSSSTKNINSRSLRCSSSVLYRLIWRRHVLTSVSDWQPSTTDRNNFVVTISTVARVIANAPMCSIQDVPANIGILMYVVKKPDAVKLPGKKTSNPRIMLRKRLRVSKLWRTRKDDN